MTKLANVIFTEGLFADLPDVADAPIGALYSATDTGTVYRRDEDDTWHAWATVSATLPDPSGAPDGQVLQTFSGAYVLDDDPGGSSGGYLGYIHLRDQQTAGTEGGTFTSGSYQTRVLNTEASDTNNDCTLSSNQITLVAGTYECQIVCPAYAVDYNKARLRNVTDAATVLVGTSEYNGSGMTKSRIVGRFTIAGSKALEVQHACVTTRSTNGLGVAANLTEVEVYAVAEFWRVS